MIKLKKNQVTKKNTNNKKNSKVIQCLYKQYLHLEFCNCIDN
jgi:hypothetical protein